MIFDTSGLCSKCGFQDGDLLDDLAFDLLGIDDYQRFDDKALLAVLVNEYVVPVLDQDVETFTIETIHNPIRVRSVDGREVEWVNGEAVGVVLTPPCVEVSDATIRVAIESAIA